jgi:hypothetical protein
LQRLAPGIDPPGAATSAFICSLFTFLFFQYDQGGDSLYSTSADIGNPLSWTAPKPFFPVIPDIVKEPQGKGWLDFWVICDDEKNGLDGKWEPFSTAPMNTFAKFHTKSCDHGEG